MLQLHLRLVLHHVANSVLRAQQINCEFFYFRCEDVHVALQPQSVKTAHLRNSAVCTSRV
jgi:hypothetical protein